MYQGLLVENQFGQNLHGKHPVSHFHQSDDTFMYDKIQISSSMVGCSSVVKNVGLIHLLR